MDGGSAQDQGQGEGPYMPEDYSSDQSSPDQSSPDQYAPDQSEQPQYAPEYAPDQYGDPYGQPSWSETELPPDSDFREWPEPTEPSYEAPYEPDQSYEQSAQPFGPPPNWYAQSTEPTSEWTQSAEEGDPFALPDAPYEAGFSSYEYAGPAYPGSSYIEIGALRATRQGYLEIGRCACENSANGRLKAQLDASLPSIGLVYGVDEFGTMSTNDVLDLNEG